MSNYSNREQERADLLKKVVVGGVLVGASYGLYVRFHVCESHQRLVRTGLCITVPQIRTQAIRWPFQKVQTFSLTPTTHHFNVESMSSESIPFKYNANFTIGPRNTEESLQKYVTYALNIGKDDTKDGASIKDLISGVVAGEARAVAANSDMQHIFEGRGVFKDKITEQISRELEKYGMEVFNGNLGELVDHGTSNYFKTKEGKIGIQIKNEVEANNAESTRDGDIKKSAAMGETKKRKAEIEAEATKIENERHQQVAIYNASLEKIRSEQKLISETARINADMQAQVLLAEKQSELQSKRLETETQTKRAVELSKIRVEAETNVAYAQGIADALIKEATGKAQSVQLQADAELYKQKTVAEGIKAKYNAEAEGFNNLVKSFGGDPGMVLKFKMLESGLFEKLAHENSQAVQGMKPNLTVWANNSGDAMGTISDLVQKAVPLRDIIRKQTGMDVLPEWLVRDAKVTPPVEQLK